ncbi:MAG: hypothetical protein HKN57_00865 [Xanthomonadales bacterium]|nr:hypothetical protein [Gammaproteobacteria bacterium]NND55779.1 hypothetical protein [Xanthomonadales bacterium]
MNRSIATLTGLSLLVCAALLLAFPVYAQDKPQLSEEIRKVIETQGVEAAKQRFAELYPSQKDAYTVDMQAMMQLGQEYMVAGDMDKGMQVMEMAALMAQDLAGQMYANPQSGEMMQRLTEQEMKAKAQQDHQEELAREEEQRQKERELEQSRGRSRDDLGRFVGLYTDPDNPQRTLFVTVSCDGFLVTGPMWADVGPWWMRSAAETVFTYSDSFMSFSMEFETDAAGNEKAMSHELDGIGSPVERSGPLPADWDECLERPRR